MFNAHSVSSVVKTSRIADKVDHRTLILPQFSAPGVDMARVEYKTGWHCKFGPAYARDIPACFGYDLEMPFVLAVVPERCKGCRTCVEVCPKGVLELYRLDGVEHAILAQPPIKLFELVEVV